MDDRMDAVFQTIKEQDKSSELMDRLVSVARPGTVFSEPVTSGDQTVITASEVVVGMGVGFGVGAGPAPEREEAAEVMTEDGEEQGIGGGGGGGGMSMGRPVAVISVGPQGVRVEPIVDASKVAITLFTALGAMVVALARLMRARK